MKIRVTILAALLIIVIAVVIGILPDVITPPMVKEISALTDGISPPEGKFLQDVIYRHQLLGKDFDLDIYYPLIPARERFTSYNSDLAPFLVFFHGGSWLHGDKNMIRIIDPFLHKLRENGIAVVAVNYTDGLAGGLKAPVENCRASLSWLRDHGKEYGLNPKAMGLYGVSAGAHLALMSVPAVMNDPGLELRFILEEFGPVDLKAMAEGDAFESSRILALFPDSLLEKYSPILYVEKNWPPLLMLHGTSDSIVSIHQTEMLAEKLETMGVPYAFQIVPGGDHGFFNKPQFYWRELEGQCLSFLLPLVFPEEDF